MPSASSTKPATSELTSSPADGERVERTRADLTSARGWPAGAILLAALVVCGATKADAVMVGGEWRVRAGKIIGLDLAKLIAEHSAAARDLRVAAGNADNLRF